ncbi:MAG: alpha/beta fold hydrolase [Chitinophagales bacterium]|nr:alpha/beta fold hydrolase [Chitinophagales bacterium]
MKLRFSLSLFFTILSFVSFSQNSKHLLGVAENPNILRHLEDVYTKMEDTTYIYSAIPSTPEIVSDRNGAPQHFPYPIIFIHGLTGSADSWLDFYSYALNQGWSYGGNIRFNLNSDNNLFYSNIFSASQIDVDDFNSNLPAADFYLVNFNCGFDGTSYGDNFDHPSQSNQAAIVKQGLAIKHAVKHVLDATGKDKVILMGHSMGGLAIRQYLQNSNLWQQDGAHHVAKLITTGTPHGGSNASFPGISGFLGVDESSDAVRDLRRSYFYSGAQGVFLFGGVENATVMNDLLAGFYNYDVNCNGSEGNQITGLNQKNLPNNLDFSCIYSDVAGIGDGVVGTTQARLKSYYTVVCETFKTVDWHSNLPENNKANFEAFDEPDYYNLSYKIDLNEPYNGFVTKQAPDAEYAIDYDDFVFTTPQSGMVKVHLANIATYPFGVSILGHPNYNYIFDQTYQNDPIQTQTIQLPAGTYYLEFYANGNNSSWQYPYSFRLEWTPTNPTSTTDINDNFNIHLSPNPVVQYVNLSIRDLRYKKGYLRIQNELGQVLYRSEVEGDQIDKSIDIGIYPEGVYFVILEAEHKVVAKKILKIGRQ